MSLIKCIFCEGMIDKVIDFGNFPYSCGANEDIQDLKYKFEIGVCKKCGLIQQMNIPDPNILYSITNHEGIGKIWDGHYNESAKFVLNNLNENKKNNILEIGGGSGKIINKIIDKKFINTFIVADFNYRGENNKKLIVKNGLFEDTNFSEHTNKIDLIYSSHVFEHISDFGKHIDKCYNLLNDDGKLVILLPNFSYWIENNFLNAFVQEHNIYPTKDNIIEILSKNKFKILEYKYYDNHSLYISFTKSTTINDLNLDELHIKNKKLLIDYKNYLDNLIDNYKSILGEEKYYIFGAHIFSQILLFSGKLNISNCIGIFDNSNFKQGKYLYGTNLNVLNPDLIQSLTESNKIIVNAGAYTNEIKEQIEKLNNLVKII